MFQRKLIALLSVVAVLALMAGVSYATPSRTDALTGEVGSLRVFMDDYANIFTFPTSVVRQNNLVLADLGTNSDSDVNSVSYDNQNLTIIKNFVGLKESGGDIAQIADFVALTPQGFSVLAGSGPNFYSTLAVGAVGGILALSVVAPELCVRLYTLVKEHRHDEAVMLQRRLTPLARTVTVRLGVAGLNLAATMLGYSCGEVRSPLGPPPPEAADIIRRKLIDLDLLRM